MQMERLSAPAIKALPRDTVVVIPISSTEQHGPHLPVGTDAMIGQGVVDRLDFACGGKLLLLPMLKLGCSEHHMFFGGTLTLSHETFKVAVLEVIDSMFRHGFRRFLIHNSHGGNRAVGGVITEQASRRWPDAEIVFATWFQVAAANLKPLVKGSYPAVGHACEFETSVMQVLHPELVDMTKAVDDGPTDAKWPFKGDLFAGGGAARSLPFTKETKYGVFGKATLATPEKGDRILEITIRDLMAMLEVAWPGCTGAKAKKTKKQK